MSCVGSDQNGPPTFQCQPQFGHFSGTDGPLPGWNFVLSPFVTDFPTGCSANVSHPTHWYTYDTLDAAILHSFAEV
eukprot:31135-Pelagococcus_subviridis.AAC.25